LRSCRDDRRYFRVPSCQYLPGVIKASGDVMLTQSTLAIQPHAWLLRAARQGPDSAVSLPHVGDGAGNQVAHHGDYRVSVGTLARVPDGVDKSACVGVTWAGFQWRHG
jgi:hypothetical protein